MKWEYKTIELKLKRTFLAARIDYVGWDQVLNNLGQQGWELVKTTFPGVWSPAIAVFKRPL